MRPRRRHEQAAAAAGGGSGGSSSAAGSLHALAPSFPAPAHLLLGQLLHAGGLGGRRAPLEQAAQRARKGEGVHVILSLYSKWLHMQPRVGRLSKPRVGFALRESGALARWRPAARPWARRDLVGIAGAERAGPLLTAAPLPPPLHRRSLLRTPQAWLPKPMA